MVPTEPGKTTDVDLTIR